MKESTSRSNKKWKCLSEEISPCDSQEISVVVFLAGKKKYLTMNKK